MAGHCHGPWHSSSSVELLEKNAPIVVIKGSVLGNAGHAVVISAVTEAAPSVALGRNLAIASLTIGGSARYAQILGGYNVESVPLTADAQIGAVKVGGD